MAPPASLGTSVTSRGCSARPVLAGDQVDVGSELD